MYRMLIVDDEPLLAQGMRRAVERTELFEVSTAGDGRSALLRIEEERFDALFLDISMPDMDGIALMEALSERGIALETVVISGYEEFDYAQQALRYGAKAYVLKPVSPKDVAAIAIKISEKLDAEQRERREREELLQFVTSQRSAIKQKLLYDILTRAVAPRHLEEIRQLYGVDMRGKYFTAALISLNRESDAMEEVDFQISLHRAEQVIEQVFIDVPEANLFNMENARYVLLLSAREPFDPALFDSLLEKTAEELERVPGLEAFIGRGNEVAGLENAVLSYRAASDALEYRAMFGGGQIYRIGDFRKNPHVLEMDAMQTNLVECLRHMNYDGAEAQLEKMFAYLEENQQAVSDAQMAFFCARATIALTGILLENGMENPGALASWPLPPGGRASVLESTRARAMSMLSAIRSEIFAGYREKDKRLAIRVREYLQENYADSALSVNGIALFMNYSANYLGNAFRREYGATVTDYLNKFRVEIAKKLMDETPLKVYEIASQVGFNDQHYFSKIFRKAVGLSPRDYRLARTNL